MGAEIPAYSATSAEEIPAIVERLRKTFWTHKTRPLSFRIQQLRKLYWALEDNKDAILEACKSDLGKGSFEAMVTEVAWVMNDCIFMSKKLPEWAKDEKADDIDLANKFMSPKIRKDPLGVVLVVGAFNFPIQLSLGPVIGAIAGGNTVVLKPSENAPKSAMIMQKIMAESLDPDCYTCVQGAIPEMKALLAEKWDKIFFTGSATVGKIIAQAAAPTLTPVTLELGGRNPAIITKKADIRLAAKRLLWAKTLNAGQVCISHNYTLVDNEVLPQFVSELQKSLKEFFPNGAKNNPDYGKIVNKSSFNRIKKMLDSTSGKVVAGGATDESELYIEPTVVLISSPTDSLMVDESFGPLMPVIGFSDLDAAIALANNTHETPLGLYAFGSKAETDKILSSTKSGGASVNDGFYHGSIPTLAFGGVGDSGSGSYRGRSSFDCFVHRRSITTTPGWMESLLAVRYPPFHGTNKWSQYKRIGVLSPNFDRAGNERLGWITWLVSLGGLGKGAWSAALVGVVVVVVKMLIDRRNLGLSR